jgi:hypothetical protein
MLAICPASPWERRAFNVSAADVLGDCSPAARYWVIGYLNGVEPDPPLDAEGGPLSDSDPAFLLWRDEVRLFHQTGFWFEGTRYCELCGVRLFRSQPGRRCPICLIDR